MGPCSERWSGFGRMAMPHKEIGIVVAMRREVAPLLGGVRALRANGLQFYELENAAVVVGGIGCKAAIRAAEALVGRYSPSTLVSAGIAGALTPQLKVGDVIRAREVVDAESGTRFVSQGGEGTLVTALSVSGAAEKRVLAERWNADVVDMEASAVAAVAQREWNGFHSYEVDFG